MDKKNNQKRNNIILISCLAVIIAGLGAYLYINKTGLLETKPTAEVHEWTGAKYIVAEEALNRAGEGIEFLERYLIEGKTFTAISAVSDDQKIFEFRDDGTYYGYTTRENDDLGKWDIKSENDGIYVVISSVGATNRYKLSHNNNKDITLVGDDNVTFVLVEKQPKKEEKISIFDDPKTEEKEDDKTSVEKILDDNKEDNVPDGNRVDNMLIEGTSE